MSIKTAKTIVVTILLCVLYGCQSTVSNYVGTWKRDAGMFSSVVVINSDGSGNFSGGIGNGGSFNWHEDGDHIVIEEQRNGQNTNTGTAKISDDSKGLTVSTNGGSFILTRQQ